MPSAASARSQTRPQAALPPRFCEEPKFAEHLGAFSSGNSIKSHTKKTTHRKSVMRGLFHMRQNQGISRQGVHDLIKRSGHILDDYETKLHLVERFVSLKEKVEAIRMAADDPEEVRKISDELLKEL